MQSAVNLPSISSLLVLDADGGRVAVKYFDPSITAASATVTPAKNATAAAADKSSAQSASTVGAGANEALLKSQLSFEKKIYAKSFGRQGGVRGGMLDGGMGMMGMESMPDVIQVDNAVVVYKLVNDIILCVVGSSFENELILHSVLSCLDESLQSLLKGQVSKKTLVENLDLLLLAVDEIIDEGLILETDSNLVVQRVCMVGGSGHGDGKGGEVPLAEQTFTQALQTARDQLIKNFR